MQYSLKDMAGNVSIPSLEVYTIHVCRFILASVLVYMYVSGRVRHYLKI